MQVTDEIKQLLITTAKQKRVYLEGNILKIINDPTNDPKFAEYINNCKERDSNSRKKRLEVTKQVQNQNKELARLLDENDRVNKQLSRALEEASTSADEARLAEKQAMDAKLEAERLRDVAVDDFDSLRKRTQFELMGKIVRAALMVILGVGILTTVLFAYTIFTGSKNAILESTWSNMFGILLTNAFSIVGTVMGVKYASGNKE